MPSAKDIQATVLAVVTFIVRPFIFLLVGLSMGYCFGFADAFRDHDTLGDKAARIVYRVHPASVSAGVYQRSTVIRDTVQSRSGLTEIPPN